jgi:hydrogenase expression/formation protein HypD
MSLQLKDLYEGFRNPEVIKALALQIQKEAKTLPKKIRVMEVCGGHTHTIMKYGLNQLMPENIEFIHGPGCPVCVMPKERIDHAYTLAMQEDVILVTLGDMIKVPGSNGNLANARAKGADVRFVYSPMDTIKIAVENPSKKVIFFAIGFETTTPMTAALIDYVIKKGISNILFHINHVTVPAPMRELIHSHDEQVNSYDSQIDAFIGPAHVSVISGSKIYEEFPRDFHIPVVVSGFEPIDVMEALLMIVKQFNENRCELEIQYTRSVSYEGNVKAQELINTYMTLDGSFKWRGLGRIRESALKLKDEYKAYDAELIYKAILPIDEIDDHKLCICGDIMRGIAKPNECTVFGTICKPSSPLGSCMVSSEGACSAYYKFGNLLSP